MFRWIISARRPLSLLELCEGIAFTLEDHHWDGKKIPTDMDRVRLFFIPISLPI